MKIKLIFTKFPLALLANLGCKRGEALRHEESKVVGNGLLGYAAEEINTAWDGGGELIFKFRIWRVALCGKFDNLGRAGLW
jgi:hypothetical protein